MKYRNNGENNQILLEFYDFSIIKVVINIDWVCPFEFLSFRIFFSNKMSFSMPH